MLAQEYGQPPHDVALWPADWIAAALTVREATIAAANERRIREARKSRMRGGR